MKNITATNFTATSITAASSTTASDATKLNIVHRKPPITACLSIGRHENEAPAAAFASSVSGRHSQALGRALGRVPFLEREFLAPGGGLFVSNSNLRRDVHLHLSPSLRVEVLRSSLSHRPIRKVETFVRQIEPIRLREHSQDHRTILRERMMERLHRLETVLTKRHVEFRPPERDIVTRQAVRTELEPETTASSPAHPRQHLVPSPVARIVTRSAPNLSANQRAAMASKTQLEASMTPSARGNTTSPNPSASASPVAMPGQVSVNVRQLTDQVVRAIDQRILARRERLGRF